MPVRRAGCGKSGRHGALGPAAPIALEIASRRGRSSPGVAVASATPAGHAQSEAGVAVPLRPATRPRATRGPWGAAHEEPPFPGRRAGRHYATGPVANCTLFCTKLRANHTSLVQFLRVME